MAPPRGSSRGSHDREPDDADDPGAWGRPPAGGWGSADPYGDRPADPYAGQYADPYADPHGGAAPRREYEQPPGEPHREPHRGQPYGDPYAGGSYGEYYGESYGGYARGAPGPYGAPEHGRGRADPLGDELPPVPWQPDPPRSRPAGRVAAYPGSARRAARRRRRPPWIALAVAAAVVAAVLVLGFVAPGWFVTRVLDAAAVQNGVTRILTDDYGVDGVADVRCPERVEVTADATFTCDATVDGDPVTVPVRVTDGDGAYEVGRPT